MRLVPSQKKYRRFIIFLEFFQVWKIALQISRLFQEFKTLYKPFKDVQLVKFSLMKVFILECPKGQKVTKMMSYRFCFW